MPTYQLPESVDANGPTSDDLCRLEGRHGPCARFHSATSNPVALRLHDVVCGSPAVDLSTYRMSIRCSSDKVRGETVERALVPSAPPLIEESLGASVDARAHPHHAINTATDLALSGLVIPVLTEPGGRCAVGVTKDSDGLTASTGVASSPYAPNAFASLKSDSLPLDKKGITPAGSMAECPGAWTSRFGSDSVHLGCQKLLNATDGARIMGRVGRPPLEVVPQSTSVMTSALHGKVLSNMSVAKMDLGAIGGGLLISSATNKVTHDDGGAADCDDFRAHKQELNVATVEEAPGEPVLRCDRGGYASPSTLVCAQGREQTDEKANPSRARNMPVEGLEGVELSGRPGLAPTSSLALPHFSSCELPLLPHGPQGRPGLTSFITPLKDGDAPGEAATLGVKSKTRASPPVVAATGQHLRRLSAVKGTGLSGAGKDHTLMGSPHRTPQEMDLVSCEVAEEWRLKRTSSKQQHSHRKDRRINEVNADLPDAEHHGCAQCAAEDTAPAKGGPTFRKSPKAVRISGALPTRSLAESGNRAKRSCATPPPILEEGPYSILQDPFSLALSPPELLTVYSRPTSSSVTQEAKADRHEGLQSSSQLPSREGQVPVHSRRSSCRSATMALQGAAALHMPNTVTKVALCNERAGLSKAELTHPGDDPSADGRLCQRPFPSVQDAMGARLVGGGPAKRARPFALLLVDESTAPEVPSCRLVSPHDDASGADRSDVLHSSPVAAASPGDGGVAELPKGDWNFTERVVMAGPSRLTDSRTVRTMAEHVANGQQISIAFLKCDLCCDLLRDPTCFMPMTLLGFPMMGVRLERVGAAPVSTAADCLRTLKMAHSKLTVNDFATGSLLVTISLKQEAVHTASGKRQDIWLSSFSMLASTAVECDAAMDPDRYPVTSRLLRQLFRGPVQAAVSLCTLHLSPGTEELQQALRVQRALCRLDTLSPLTGSARSLVHHLGEKIRVVWAMLRTSKQRAAGRRQELMEAAIKRDLQTATLMEQREGTLKQRSSSNSMTDVAWEDASYAWERRRRFCLRATLRALMRLKSDFENALAAPVTVLPQPYTLFQWRDGVAAPAEISEAELHATYRRAATRTSSSYVLPLCDPLSEVTNGLVDVVPLDHVSDDSDRAVGDSVRRKIGVPSIQATPRKSAGFKRSNQSTESLPYAAAVTRGWRASTPEMNLLAGDAAFCVHGIRPLFRFDDPRLAAAFGAESDGMATAAAAKAMETVVYLEQSGDGAAGGTAPRSSPASPHLSSEGGKTRAILLINNVAVGGLRASRSTRRFTVDELTVSPSAVTSPTVAATGSGCSHAALSASTNNGGDAVPYSCRGSRTPWRSSGSSSSVGVSNAATSTVVQSAFRDFSKGYGVSLVGFIGRGAETDAVTRMMNSPLWSEMRDMVAYTLSSPTASEGAAVVPPTGGGGAAIGADDVTLYLSITQPLSMHLVRDLLRSEEGAGCESWSSDAMSSSASMTQDLLSFQSAWTPAGPIVAGARFVPLTSVTHFSHILQELPTRVRESVNDHGGNATSNHTHLLVTFLLRRFQLSARVGQGGGPATGGAVQASCDVTPGSSRHPCATPPPSSTPPGDVFFASAALLLSTSTTFWNGLITRDHVPPAHPLNLFRPLYRHRHLHVIDVAESAIGRAAVLLCSQQHHAEQQHILRARWHTRWSMTAYTRYLSEYCDTLQWCLSKAAASSTDAAANAIAPLCRRSSLPEKGDARSCGYLDLSRPNIPSMVRLLFSSGRVKRSHVALALRQVKLMYSIAMDLLQSPILQTLKPPQALFESALLYKVTTPPRKGFRGALDDLLSTRGWDAENDDASSTFASSRFCGHLVETQFLPTEERSMNGHYFQQPAATAATAAAPKETRSKEKDILLLPRPVPPPVLEATSPKVPALNIPWSPVKEAAWKALQGARVEGVRALPSPHNSNLSSPRVIRRSSRWDRESDDGTAVLAQEPRQTATAKANILMHYGGPSPVKDAADNARRRQPMDEDAVVPLGDGSPLPGPRRRARDSARHPGECSPSGAGFAPLLECGGAAVPSRVEADVVAEVVHHFHLSPPLLDTTTEMLTTASRGLGETPTIGPSESYSPRPPRLSQLADRIPALECRRRPRRWHAGEQSSRVAAAPPDSMQRLSGVRGRERRFTPEALKCLTEAPCSSSPVRGVEAWNVSRLPPVGLEPRPPFSDVPQ